MSVAQSLSTWAFEQSGSVERHQVPRLAGEMLSGVLQYTISEQHSTPQPVVSVQPPQEHEAEQVRVWVLLPEQGQAAERDSLAPGVHVAVTPVHWPQAPHASHAQELLQLLVRTRVPVMQAPHGSVCVPIWSGSHAPGSVAQLVCPPLD
jgi:hypothetical protein